MAEWTDKQLELEIEAKTTTHAKRCGFRGRKVVFLGRRGAPDRWFFGPGPRLIIIEFKAPDGVLSYHQKKNIKWLRGYGFEVHVIDNIETGMALFDGA